MNVDNSTLFWLLFYIAVGIVGIFLALVYIISTKDDKKPRRHRIIGKAKRNTRT